MTVTISRTTAPALVSSVTDNQQINPSIVALPNGGYAVLWQDYGARLGATFLQQYTAAGVKAGPETVISGLPEFVRPSASTLSTGELLLTWTNSDIMSQRMSAAGVLIGSPQTVNTTLAGAQTSPVATALQGGGYAVAWMSEDQDGSLMGVYAQRFNAAGVKVGAEFRVNTAVAGNQNNPAIGAMSDGGFVVTWESVIPGASGSPVGIYMQRYDASGAAAGAETLVSTHAVSPNFTASQSDPSVTGLTSGFVVVWQGRPSTPTAGIDPDEIYMQLYDASVAAVGGQTMVNTTTAHPQKLPVVTSLPDGGFVVAWLDGWAVGVSAQRFSATGERAGLETVLTNQHLDFDINPALAGLSGGGYAVAWAGNDGSGDGIYQGAVVTVTGGVLSAAVETAVGDSANDIFYAAPGTLNPGDRLDGGAGTDVLRMSSPGTIDLTGVTLTNIEALNGSSGDDTIIFPGAAPAGLYFYGAGGSDTLVFGADTNIGQFNTLSLPRVMAAPGAGVTFTLGAGQRSAIDDLLSIDGSGATVTADISSWGGALNAELRAKAFAHGVDFIQEPGGVTYSAAGAAIQAGSQISINPDAFAYTPDVAGLADGRVVVVSVGGGGFNGVGLQLFDAQGANLGAKAVGSESFVFDPAVAALSNGGFVVTWQGLDSEFTGIKARVFNAAGDPVSAVLQVNSNPAGQQFRPQVAALVNGGFVIGWDGEGGGLQRYTATGERVGAEISKLGGRLDLAALADGGFVVVAESVGFALPHGLYATRYAADGSKVGAEVLLSSSSAGAVSGLTGGGFVAVWSVGATSGASIHAQRFDASGAKAGPESIIGAEGVNWSTLDVAGTADGGFTVAWSSEEGAIGKAIHTQRFDALGLRIGKEAVFAGDFADSPDITALAGGGTALVWETGSSPHAQMLINAPLDYHALTAGADTIVGGSGATHVVALPDQVNSGDSVSGGAGIDTFELASPGVANLAGMASFTGFEIILAMNGDHTLIVSQAILEGLTKVDLGYGKNTLQLGAPGLLDVSNVSLRGFESLLGSSGNDTFVVRNVHAFTTIDGGDGIDTLTLNPEQIGQGWSLEPWSGTTVGVRVIGFENLTGSAFSEVLIGDAGPNVLSGLGGDDNLDGGRGNDTLLGGDGADTLTGGEGDDILDGGAGVDRASYSAATGAISINLTLSGPQSIGGGMGVDTLSGIEVVVGGAFADVLIGDAGDNTLTGDAGDDIIEGGPGDDILNGSSGIDTVSYSAATAGVTVNLSLVGTRDTLGAGRDNLSGFENIIGSAFSDILTGDPGANMLVGGGGNDILDGGGSADQLYGGAGDDTFRVNTQADLVFEFAGQGIDTVITTASFYLYDHIENLTLATGSADLFGVGNGLANTITGNAGANLLLGGGGDDVISGGSGNDRLYGEDGNDVLSGGTGSDWLVGGAGADTLDGATGGVGEQDFLYGEAGDDSYLVDAANDLTFEDIGGGTDTVMADFAGGTYYLYANVENLTLAGTTANGVGNELDNVITGNASANWLLGGAGNDTLNGKGGGDVLFGQGGADVFVFEHGTGGDVIGDFAVGVDKVRLTGIYSSFAEVQSHMVQNGGDSAIDLGQGDLVVFQHVAMASFTAGDFVF